MTQHEAQVKPGLTQNITKLSDVITCLRTEVNKDLPIQHIALLLAVIQQPGVSMQDLMEYLGMPQGSVSRNVKLLSTPGRGYELLYTSQGLINRKQVVVFPTEKCSDLIENLCCLMQNEIQEDDKRCSCDAAAN